MSKRKTRRARPTEPTEERMFIDEIPLDQPMTNPIQPHCDFLCHIAEQEMRA